MDLLEYIRGHDRMPDGRPWDYGQLSANPHITLEMKLASPDLPWNWLRASINPTLSFKYAVEHPHPWDWEKVLMYSILTLDEVLAHSRMEGSRLSWRKRISLSRLRSSKSAEKIAFAPLSANRAITLDLIRERPHLPWNKKYLSLNPNLTLEFVRHPPAHLLGTWDWDELSRNSAFSVDLILSQPDLPWSYPHVCMNPTLTVTQTLEIEELDQPLYYSANPNLPLTYLLSKNLILPYLNRNPGLNLDEVLVSVPRCPYEWYVLIAYVGKPSPLTLLRTERRHPHSYFSLLPKDLVEHYFLRYLVPHYRPPFQAEGEPIGSESEDNLHEAESPGWDKEGNEE